MNMREGESKEIVLTVDPGICGFKCVITARQSESRVISITIDESECEMIKSMAKGLAPISMQALFAPMTQNPVYISAEKSGCHSSCVIPAAILKAAEVAMEMALPKDVVIRFQPDRGDLS